MVKEKLLVCAPNQVPELFRCVSQRGHTRVYFELARPQFGHGRVLSGLTLPFSGRSHCQNMTATNMWMPSVSTDATIAAGIQIIGSL